VQVSIQQRSHGPAAHRAGHPDCAELGTVRAPPSPTAPERVRRHWVVSLAWWRRKRAGNYSTTFSRGRCPPSWAPWTRCSTCACTALTHRAWMRASSPGCGLSVVATWVQVPIPQRFYGAAAYRAGYHGRADRAVRVPPSPTAPGRVRRHGLLSGQIQGFWTMGECRRRSVVQGDSSPCSGGHLRGTVFECTRSA
jgi:hypothetical protein